MSVKVKESFERTRLVKKNDKSKKFILRGLRIARYCEKVLSDKNKSNNFSLISNSTKLYIFTNK